jgi:hypothetical protein
MLDAGIAQPRPDGSEVDNDTHGLAQWRLNHLDHGRRLWLGG